MTIFGVLVLILVTECLFVFLEGARFFQIKRSTELQTQIAAEAVFANYCTPLWEEYHLLACDQRQMEEYLVTYGNGRTSENESRLNLLNYGLSGLEVEGYMLITDGKGSAYQKAVSEYMQDNILYETAKLIYGQYEVISSLLESDNSDLGSIDRALEVFEKARTSSRVSSHGTAKTSESDEVTQETSNPLQDIKKIQNMGVLELLVENQEELSSKRFDQSKAVSGRILETGKNYQIQESEWMDRILLQQYLLTYMSSYGNEKENRALSYELEYIVGKKDNDIANIKVVAERLLLIRQAANMLYIFSDTTKVEEASTLAAILAALIAMPEAYDVIKVAILTAWAYGESVLDVRALLQGKRIPLLKSQELWTLQLSGIGELFVGFPTAKESELGLGYSDYLGVMLLFSDDSSLCMHAMDMQEATIRQMDGYKDFQMDNLMIQAEATLSYRYDSVFQMFHFFADGPDWDYEFNRRINYGYGN